MSKLLASLMRNYFPKRPSGAPLHTLSKLYDVPVGFVNPLFWGWIMLILRSPKGGCCSISDDLSCSCVLLVTRPFTWYRIFYLVNLTLTFDYLWKPNHGFYLVMVAVRRPLLSSDKSYYIPTILLSNAVWTGRAKMNKIQLKSFWHSQKCDSIKSSLLRLRTASWCFTGWILPIITDSVIKHLELVE